MPERINCVLFIGNAVLGYPRPLHQFLELPLNIFTRRDAVLVFRIKDKVVLFVFGICARCRRGISL